MTIDNKVGAIFTGLLTLIFGITMCSLSMQIDDIDGNNTLKCSNSLKVFNKILLIAGSALSSFGILFFILAFSDTCHVNNISGNIYLIYFFLLGLLLMILSGSMMSQDDCNGSKQSSTALLTMGTFSIVISLIWMFYDYYSKNHINVVEPGSAPKKRKDIFPDIDLRFNSFA